MRRTPDPVLFVLLVAFAVACALVGSPVFVDYDSTNFALSIEQHDVRLHQPQPPGFVFYVWLLQAASLVTGNSLAVLRVVAVALLLAAAFFLHRLADEAYERRTARLATALFLASPVVLFHGFVTMIYPGEAFAAALAGYACFRMRERGRGAFVAAAFLAGAIGGLRQTAMGFAGPLVLVEAIRRRYRPGDFALAALAGTAGFLSWFLPQIHYSGGLEGYVESNRLLQDWISSQSPLRAGWKSLFHNVHRAFTVMLLGAGAFRLAVMLARKWGGRRSPAAGAGTAEAGAGTAPAAGRAAAAATGTSGRAELAANPAPGLSRAFVLAWTLPAALFLVLYHFPKSGYALSLWPQFSLGLALLARRAFAETPRAKFALAAACALDVGVFFALPTIPFCCRRIWELREAASSPKSSIAPAPWMPEWWRYPSTWNEPGKVLARVFLAKADFLFDRTRDFYYGGEIAELRGLGYPRSDTLLLGGLFTRAVCYALPEQRLIHADPNRRDRFLLYQDRRAFPLGDTYEVPREVRWIVVDGLPTTLRANRDSLLRRDLAPPLDRRLSLFEIVDGPLDVSFEPTFDEERPLSIRLVRETSGTPLAEPPPTNP